MLFLFGLLLILMGLIPVTPLIWLLVLVQAPMPAALEGIRLEFWQTQLLGLALSAVGLGIVLAARRGIMAAKR